MKILTLLGAAFVASTVSVSALASDDLNAFRTLSGSQVSFALSGVYSNATLTVTGPNGFRARDYSKTGSPAIDLIKAKAVDGLYKYEVTAASADTIVTLSQDDNGRGAAGNKPQKRGVSANGSFHVKNGLIVEMADKEE